MQEGGCVCLFGKYNDSACKSGGWYSFVYVELFPSLPRKKIATFVLFFYKLEGGGGNGLEQLLLNLEWEWRLGGGGGV